jgi:type I restriction enzyme, S subunit
MMTLSLPYEWSVDRLKDVATINAATLPAGTDPDYKFDYLEISNVDYYGLIDINAIERVRFEDAPSRARRIVLEGATLISSVRPNLQAVAHISTDHSDLICSTGFNVVQPIKWKLNSRFAYYVLVSEHARQYFEAVATGVGYPAVADKDFSSLVIPLPHLAEQEKIAAFLDMTCNVIDAIASRQSSAPVGSRILGVIDKQMDALVRYRKSLIHECVTGQRRITEADLDRVQAHAG